MIPIGVSGTFGLQAGGDVSVGATLMPTEPRAWVRLPSGKRLNLLDPTPLDWDDDDLAVGLSRTYRWGGHSAWPLPLSVAQHSLTVMLLRRAASPTGLTPAHELRELLHDAEEGLLGFDPIAPIKSQVGDDFLALMRRLETVVFLRYGLPKWTPEQKAAHKRADRVAAATEAFHVAGWTRAEIRHALKIPYHPLDVDPLVAVYGCPAWEPWSPTVAHDRFLAELHRLKHRLQPAASGPSRPVPALG